MAASDGTHDSEQLAVRGAAYVEAFVELIRDRAVRPILAGARIAIIGLIGVVVALAATAAIIIGVVRLLTEDAFGGRVWITDLVIGGIFLVAGALLVWLGLRPKKVSR